MGTGRGMNLLMTADIFERITFTDDRRSELILYGNDYMQSSIDLAKKLFELPNVKHIISSKLGIFCRGDSTDLSFVPSDSFDFVFSGYIEPITDPLHLDIDGSGTSDDKNCKSSPIGSPDKSPLRS